jgi:uncharacterized membrane protein YecN with MAPEG domain
MVLPITLTFAGACALLHIWLAARVSRLRAAHKVSIGDGGNEQLIRRMRAHANYGENMPIVLIMIGLIELAGGDARILWAAGIVFILSRILHGFGMDQPSPSRLRMIGMIGNTIVLLGLAGWALSFAYLQAPPAPHETMIGPGRTASAPAAPTT